MFFGIFRLALCILIVCELSEAVFPTLEIDFCKLSQYNAQKFCQCIIPFGNTSFPCMPGPPCSDVDQSNANKACQKRGFSEGHCEYRELMKTAFDLNMKCRSYVCPTTRGIIMTDFKDSNIDSSHARCTCLLDHESVYSAVAQYGKVLYQLQSALAKMACPTKLSPDKNHKT